MTDTPEPTRTERALRELAEAMTGSRPRNADDIADPRIPVAATAILARDAVGGPEVLLIERPDRGSFAGAWVFPGGKLEPGDAADGASEEENARRAGVRETAEETGLRIDPRGLVTLSCWDPPPGLPLRIRTWFFLGPAPQGSLTLSPDEAVAARWLHPADVLAAHGRGELTLYPPTWVTLYGLADRTDVADMLDAARLGGLRRFETVARRGPQGPVLLWREDAEYDPETPDAAAALSDSRQDESVGTRHRLEVGALPWRYLRTG